MTNSMKNNIHFEDDTFYFESDHLALVGNRDYSEVLKTFFVLCAQRDKAIKNYNEAVKLKKEALENPELILEKISNGESLGMPDMLCVPEVPTIDWSKYDVKIPQDIKHIYSETNERTTHKKSEQNSKFSPAKDCRRWTAEEQKRLEELLQIYPPEPIEVKRFEKIAAALGNRTIQQVTSRVQKYFLKLYKAGLPIPGRIPKHAEKHKRSSLHKHQRHNHYLWKPTTFFPDLCVPVVMNDLDNVPGPSVINDETVKASTSTNYLLQTGYDDSNNHLPQRSENELQLELLTRIKQERLKISDENLYSHVGFSCDYCTEEPIIGIRWHCISCKSDSVDFCSDCLVAQLYSDNCHPLTHHFISCYDDKESTNVSDSESYPSSVVGSSIRYNGSSESSDSDYDMDSFNGDEEENSGDNKLVVRNESISESSDSFINKANGGKAIKSKIKHEIIFDDYDEKQCSKKDIVNKEYFEYGTVKAENINTELDIAEFKIENDEVNDRDLFNMTDNVSYNYLHSNLLLD